MELLCSGSTKSLAGGSTSHKFGFDFFLGARNGLFVVELDIDTRGRPEEGE